MSDIGCEICMDLAPLVRDGVASEASRRAVERHLALCPACRAALADEAAPCPAPDPAALWRRARRRLRGVLALALLAGLILGLGLTGGADMFYNSALMPLLGAGAYLVFRRRAFWLLPLAVMAAQLFCRLLRTAWGVETLDVFSGLVWACICCVLALAGAAIAGLFHFALKKEG